MSRVTPPTAHLLALDDPAARAAYVRLWEASPQRTVFAHPEAVRVWAEAFGYSLRLAAVPEGDGFAAALPVFEKRRGPIMVAALPPLMPVVSPLLAGPLAEHEVHARQSALDGLLGLLAARYSQTSLLLHPSLTDARPFTWGGWRVTPRYTYALCPGDGRGGWSKKTRQIASREAVRYRVEEGQAYAEAAVAFAEAAYERRGLSTGLDGTAFRRLAAALAAMGLARCFAAFGEDADAPEAAGIVLVDGPAATDWVAGSHPGPARTVLLATLFERLAAEGIRDFDFGGANVASIAEFKRKFGGRLVPYFHARHVGHPVLRLLDRFRG